jgi:uncharacterized protein with HEPN domain
MPDRSFLIRLSDIRGEIAGIRDLTKNATADSFAASWAMTRAVQHALLIIAEAAKHVPQEYKTDYADVPWQKIHGLGNLLRHEYRRIDPLILWSIASDHLDGLDKAAGELLAKFGPG